MPAVNHRPHLQSSPWDWSSPHTGRHTAHTQGWHSTPAHPCNSVPSHRTRDLPGTRAPVGAVQRIQSNQGPVADANDQEDEGDQGVEHSGHHLAHSPVGRQEQPTGASALRSLSQA